MESLRKRAYCAVGEDFSNLINVDADAVPGLDVAFRVLNMLQTIAQGEEMSIIQEVKNIYQEAIGIGWSKANYETGK